MKLTQGFSDLAADRRSFKRSINMIVDDITTFFRQQTMSENLTASALVWNGSSNERSSDASELVEVRLCFGMGSSLFKHKQDAKEDDFRNYKV
jgi:hypothetical protein